MKVKKREAVVIYDFVGQFAEDKDIAKQLRETVIWPQIKKGLEIELDFDKVTDATQSFVHALVSQLLRETQGEALDLIYFKNCNETVRGIITMVVDYMAEG